MGLNEAIVSRGLPICDGHIDLLLDSQEVAECESRVGCKQVSGQNLNAIYVLALYAPSHGPSWLAR
jgi:hypothetical protein